MTQEADAAYMSSPQAARLLGITGVGVAQLIRQGKIPAVKIANRWLIPRGFLEEFARTYVGKRGRPRKRRRAGAAVTAVLAARPVPVADAAVAPGVDAAEPAPADRQLSLDLAGAAVPAVPAEVVPAVEARPPEAAAVSAAAEEAVVAEAPPAEAPPAEAPAAEAPAAEATRAESAQARVVAPVPEATAVEAEPEEEEREGGAAFRVSAEVNHLDRNYDFEVYERGRITQKARIIVARLRPKIPSLPQFSFRWDYRYEHLNVDIHGVEPAALEWWTMGQNGYTGHLPRRLAAPGYVFEAIIWLPVTFVFRGKLTLSGGSAGVDLPPSVASTTGGLRKLWSKWPGKPRP